jgi:hypothetical protein
MELLLLLLSILVHLTPGWRGAGLGEQFLEVSEGLGRVGGIKLGKSLVF